jgi:hypothetical protein
LRLRGDYADSQLDGHNRRTRGDRHQFLRSDRQQAKEIALDRGPTAPLCRRWGMGVAGVQSRPNGTWFRFLGTTPRAKSKAADKSVRSTRGKRLCPWRNFRHSDL